MKQKNRKNRTFIRRLILILIGLFLGVNIYSANAGGLLGNQLPMPFGYGIANVMSGSMEPTLKVGSLLYYRSNDLDDFNKDDILVYRYKNHTISHRIVEQVKGGFITKGDANQTNDFLVVNNEQVLGKGTQWCIPYLGLYADFIYTHKYILFITVSLLVIDLGYDIYRKQKHKEVIIDEEKN